MTMMPRHRTILDFSFEAISHYEIMSISPLRDKLPNLAKVMAAVSVTKDNEIASRVLNPVAKRAPVAFHFRVDNPRTTRFGDVN